MLELKLACMLDAITELAFFEGVMCPDAEDFLPLNSPNAAASSIVLSARSLMVQKFTTWYTGDETANENREHAQPSWARILFTEKWELKLIIQDPYVAEYLSKHCGYEPEQLDHTCGTIAEGEGDIETAKSLELLDLEGAVGVEETACEIIPSVGNSMSGEQLTIEEAVSQTSLKISPSFATGSLDSVASLGQSVTSVGPIPAPKGLSVYSINQFDTPRDDESSSDENEDEEVPDVDILQPIHPPRPACRLISCYEESLNSVSGRDLRLSMMKRHLPLVMTGRQTSMVRLMYPPGPTKSIRSFMMPRLGVVVPFFEMPPVRYQLFPSRTLDAYSVETICSWYRPEDMDDDDDRMIAASIKGRKMAKYNDWLANTQQRVEEGRMSMLEEDAFAATFRSYWEPLDTKLTTITEGDAMTQQFIAMKPLPGNYDYIDTETRHYVAGSGAMNEDELMDIVAEMNRKKDEEMQLVLEAKRKLAEERRLAEEQRRLKIERAERDARLAEGVEIRRKLRIQLAEIKAERILQKERLALQLKEETEEAERWRIQLEYERVLEEEAEEDRCHMAAEQYAMGLEEVAGVELFVQLREIKNMTWEDLHSVHMAKQYEQDQVKKVASTKILEIVYQPFEPFRFREKRYTGETVYGNPNESDAYDYTDATDEKFDFVSGDVQEDCVLSDIAKDTIVAEGKGHPRGVWPRPSHNIDLCLPALLDDVDSYKTATTDDSRAKTPLRKHQRPYSTMNAGENDLLKEVEAMDYTVMEDNGKVMRSLGLQRSLANIALRPPVANESLSLPSRSDSPTRTPKHMERFSACDSADNEWLSNGKDSGMYGMSVPRSTNSAAMLQPLSIKPPVKRRSKTASASQASFFGDSEFPGRPRPLATPTNMGEWSPERVRRGANSRGRSRDKKKALLPITASDPMAVLLNKHSYDGLPALSSADTHRHRSHSPIVNIAKISATSGIPAPELNKNLQQELRTLDSLCGNVECVDHFKSLNTLGVLKMMENPSDRKKKVVPPQKYEPRITKLIQAKKTETLMLLREQAQHRSTISKYITSQAVLGDKYSIESCCPEERSNTVLDRDHFVQAFLKTLPEEFGYNVKEEEPEEPEVSDGPVPVEAEEVAEEEHEHATRSESRSESPMSFLSGSSMSSVSGQKDRKDRKEGKMARKVRSKLAASASLETISTGHTVHRQGQGQRQGLPPPGLTKSMSVKRQVSLGILGQVKSIEVNEDLESINSKKRERRSSRSLAGTNMPTKCLTEESIASASVDFSLATPGTLTTPRPRAFLVEYDDSRESSRRSSITSMESFAHIRGGPGPGPGGGRRGYGSVDTGSIVDDNSSHISGITYVEDELSNSKGGAGTAASGIPRRNMSESVPDDDVTHATHATHVTKKR